MGGAELCLNAILLTVTLEIISSECLVIIQSNAFEIKAVLSAEAMKGLETLDGIRLPHEECGEGITRMVVAKTNCVLVAMQGGD